MDINLETCSGHVVAAMDEDPVATLLLQDVWQGLGEEAVQDALTLLLRVVHHVDVVPRPIWHMQQTSHQSKRITSFKHLSTDGSHPDGIIPVNCLCPLKCQPVRQPV